MLLSVKRIAPGPRRHWFIRIAGTALSADFSTKNPKQLAWLPYEPGGDQIWHVYGLPYQSAYPTITGASSSSGF